MLIGTQVSTLGGLDAPSDQLRGRAHSSTAAPKKLSQNP